MSNIDVPLITNLMVTLTNQCTMRCPFCFVDKDIKRMSKDTMARLVQFLIDNSAECGVPPRIVFFGGEPMVEWDELIVPTVQKIRSEYKQPFYFSMTTNMTLLDEERLQFLIDNDVDCLFSIDGDEDTMRVNRPMANGSDPFPIVDAVAGMVTDMVPNAAARITVYAPTVKNLCHDIRYVENKGFGSVSVLPDLFSDWSEENIETFKEQIKLYGDHLIESFRAGKTPPIFQQYSECFYKMMLQNRCIDAGRFQQLWHCQACGKCGIGLSHHATTDYLGNIYGCLHPGPLTPESVFYLGDIYNGVDPERTRNLVDMIKAESPGGLDCGDCTMNYICDRGCAPNNYICTGKMLTPPKMFCHFYRTLMDDAIRVCNILGVEKNETFKIYFSYRVSRG